VEETTLAYDRQQLREADGSGIANVPATPTLGLVAVFDAASGRLVLQRKLSLLSSGSNAVEWSPDGSWLFVTASQNRIAAVPMYSASAPVHILYFARAVGENAVGADNFVLVPSGGSGEP
jgi:sugar lactone lactonase YvrE